MFFVLGESAAYPKRRLRGSAAARDECESGKPIIFGCLGIFIKKRCAASQIVLSAESPWRPPAGITRYLYRNLALSLQESRVIFAGISRYLDEMAALRSYDGCPSILGYLQIGDKTYARREVAPCVHVVSTVCAFYFFVACT